MHIGDLTAHRVSSRISEDAPDYTVKRMGTVEPLAALDLCLLA